MRYDCFLYRIRSVTSEEKEFATGKGGRMLLKRN